MCVCVQRKEKERGGGMGTDDAQPLIEILSYSFFTLIRRITGK